MISHRYQCIFIHIPKTAGTSIERCLSPDDSILFTKHDHRSIRNLESALFPNRLGDFFSLELARYFYQIYSMRSFKRPKHNRDQYNRYFKFSFVRNPWARAYSWYKNVMRDEKHRKAHGIPEDMTLHQFLIEYKDSWALRPQLSWITNRQGKVAVDFVGKFENLQEDFAKVCDRLNIDDVDLPRILVTDNPSFIQEYDDQSRDIIQQRYAAEIDYFGYSFET